MLIIFVELVVLFPLFLFLLLSVRASIACLSPCIDHFDFLDTSTHHSIVRICVREDTLDWTPCWDSLRLDLLPSSRRW